MLLMVEEYETFDPVDVCAFSTKTVMFEANCLADAIESVDLWSIEFLPYNAGHFSSKIVKVEYSPILPNICVCSNGSRFL